MRKAARHNLIVFSLAVLITCLATNMAADDFTNRDYRQTEVRSHWVCAYTQSPHDTLLLRCDNLVGLLYDHMMLKDGPQSKTTQYIPIWRRADNDDAAINLANILLCKETPDCEVEMAQTWAASHRSSQ